MLRAPVREGFYRLRSRLSNARVLSPLHRSGALTRGRGGSKHTSNLWILAVRDGNDVVTLGVAGRGRV
jgi:hypothetical protein